ncbi:hypothetical protein HY404_04180 [Candidatus Microgenomates bacterium]|nr:hypothetical protein [Candidatus Microgenomates bacterium]
MTERVSRERRYNPRQASEKLIQCMRRIPINTFDEDYEDEYGNESPVGALQKIDAESRITTDIEIEERTVSRRTKSEHKDKLLIKVAEVIDVAPITSSCKKAIKRGFADLYIAGIDEDRETVDEIPDEFYYFTLLTGLKENGSFEIFFDHTGQQEVKAYRMYLGDYLHKTVMEPNADYRKEIKFLQKWRRQYIDRYHRPPLPFAM